MTFTDCARDAARLLEAAGLPGADAEREAALLIRWRLGWDAGRWLAHRHDIAPTTFAEAVAPLIDRRAAREPIAYITGEREFWGRRFLVTRDVLVPRWETEFLIESALELRSTARLIAPRVADVGTGSGCLAVTLALEWPEARVSATDVSAAALAVARRNAERHEATDRVSFHLGELLAGLPGPFDVIVSNPPYVPEADRASLAPEVVDYEPSGALFAGRDGLDVIRRMVTAVPPTLVPGGWLLLEIGYGQADAVRRLVGARDDLTFVDLVPDLQGIPRTLVARRPAPPDTEVRR